METTDLTTIFPAHHNNMEYWSKKWGVTQKEIHDAILHTGSLEPQTIKTYLYKDSLLHHPVKGVKVAVKKTINFIF